MPFSPGVSPLAAFPGPRVRGGRRGVRGEKGTSGGLGRYTRSTVFEKPCGTREIALRGWEVRWSVASSQTNQGSTDNPSWLQRHLPDSVGISFSFKDAPNITFQFSITRNGTIFFTLQGGVGASVFGGNVALNASYLQQPGNIDSVEQGGFTTGMLVPVAGKGVSNSWSGNGTNDYYLGTPQGSVGAGYGVTLLHTGIHW